MNKYIVFVKEETSSQLEIDANSMDEAKEKAEQIYQEGNATFGELTVSYSPHLLNEQFKENNNENHIYQI